MKIYIYRYNNKYTYEKYEIINSWIFEFINQFHVRKSNSWKPRYYDKNNDWRKNKTHRYPLAKTKERQLSPGVLHRSPVAVAAAAAITLRCRLFPGCSADPESGRRCPHVEESLRWQLRSASCARRHVLFISQFRLLIWQKFIIFRLLKINRLNMDQMNKKIIKIFNNYIIDF